MKYFTFLIGLLITVSTLAQNHSMNLYSQASQSLQRQESEQWFKKLAPSKKVKYLIGSSSTKKNEENKTIYNENGEITEREYTFHQTVLGFNLKEYVHKQFDYTNNQLKRVDELNKQNKLIQTTLYSYFSPKKTSKTEVFRKDKKVREELNTFNLDSTRSSYTLYEYKRNTPCLRLKYNYDYYDGKQIKQVRRYNHKSKLKYTWNYDCSPKGELVVKNSTKVCKNTGVNNKGQTIEVEFFTDDKNKQTKRVTTYYFYNGKKVNVGMQNYIIEKGEEVMTFDQHLADSVEAYTSNKYYNKKGVLIEENTSNYFLYNSKEQILKEVAFKNYSKGKITFCQSTIYNELGLPTEMKTVKNGTKQIRKGVFSYQGDSLYTINYFGKNLDKVKSTYTAKVSYY